MIELTEQQVQALEQPGATPPRVVNPRTQETFVLLRLDEYERLKQDEYDDSPWTSEERHALAFTEGLQGLKRGGVGFADVSFADIEHYQ